MSDQTSSDSNPKILYMNKSTSETDMPFPSAQQLGDHKGLMDARSGNGVDEEIGGSGPSGGHGTLPVTYHLEGATQPMVVTGQSNVADPTVSTLHTQREQDGRDKKIQDSGAGQQLGAEQQSGLQPTGGRVASNVGDSAPDSGGESSSEDVRAAPPSNVPEGTANEVLAWVGDDKDRARVALEQENKRDQPRRTLIAQLNDRV